MKNRNIIGRDYEQSLIKKLYLSDKAELVAIYGRRRVGKTYLVKRFFDEQFDFYFTGLYETPRPYPRLGLRLSASCVNT